MRPAQVLQIWEFVFISLYTMEMILKVAGLGLHGCVHRRVRNNNNNNNNNSNNNSNINKHMHSNNDDHDNHTVPTTYTGTHAPALRPAPFLFRRPRSDTSRSCSMCWTSFC
jgi:hypothetical protein